MILSFLGPPGSGKGTQAKLLADKMRLPHLSLGDLLRDEVRRQTEIGRRIKALLEAGQLAPNEITNELTRQRAQQPDCRQGFILDGYPRSAEQAEALDGMPFQLDRVIYFKIDQEEVVKRLSGRRSCKNCGAVYHLQFNPPKTAGRCDVCGQALFQRLDDEPAAVRTRFEVYTRQTAPLIERYRQQSKLATIDVAGSIEEVFDKILTLIGHDRH